jgi:hypothetical protein
MQKVFLGLLIFTLSAWGGAQIPKTELRAGAPTLTYHATLLPISTDSYDIGTTTKRWRDLFVKPICLSGDCKTAWPAGGSGSSAVATSSEEAAGRIPFWTSTAGTPAELSGGSSLFTWDNTALRLLTGNSSTTLLSVFGTAYFGGTATTTISSNGSVSIPAGATLTVADLTSALVLTNGSGLFAEFAGTSCSNQFVRSLSALGAATCASVDLVNDVTGTLVVGNGGSGANSLTDHGVLVGSGTDPITALAVGTNGQLLLGSTGADPVFATLNAARSLTTTTGAGTLQIDADAELYTYGLSGNIFATTTSSGISTTTENFLSVRVPIASTITNFNCYAFNGTSTLKATVSSNPLTAGTNILYTTGTRCGHQQLTSTSTFSTTAVSAGDYIRIYVSDASPTGSRPTIIYPNFTLTKDD